MWKKASDHEDDDSPPSSMDSCSAGEPPSLPEQSTASSGRCRPPPATTRRRRTDLHLGLTLSPCSSDYTRSDLTVTADHHYHHHHHHHHHQGDSFRRGGGGDGRRRRSLFVKVYMEGFPIGRKIDLLQLDGYSGLVAHLATMFTNPHDDLSRRHQQIFIVGEVNKKAHHRHHHVLTYEDQEGDWMMAGDVPWEYGKLAHLSLTNLINII
uniref:Auxin-responsive protein n=1 Tax=Leersia perrieri TaxID=77586 RepID=A0A0D9WCI9_9ORYZ